MARRHHSPEFIEKLVREVLEESKPLTHVAKHWDIHPGVLSKWVKAHKSQAPAMNCPEGEIQELRGEIQILKDRTELLRGMLEKLYRSKYG